MAPPSHRRPGYSRKAQYSLFAAYVIAIAGAIFAALILLISVADPRGFAVLRSSAAEVTAPIARFFDSARRSVVDVTHNMEGYFDAASKNAALNKRVKAQAPKLVEAQAIKLENQRLKALLDLSEQEGIQRVAVGRLISSTSSSSRRIATLSVGRNSGVLPGQPVRGPEGLIGRVIEAGPNTARVLLLSDPDNVIPVLRLPDGLPALANGAGDGTIAIRPVDLGVNPFKKGNIIVTSGNGGLYPPNIPFARIVQKTPDGALAVPLANPWASNYVVVMKPYQEEAKAALTAAEGPAQAKDGE
jgi:rod shape-determining protein MreC